MKFVLTLLLSVVFAVASAEAQSEPETASHWRALTLIDGNAALTLIRENHPGAQPTLRDVAFQKEIDRAQRQFDERLPEVVDHAGYKAVLEGLAADFRDGHIRSRSLTKPLYLNWTGMIVARKAGAWVIASQVPVPGKPDLVGARIISCDGVDANSWARTRIELFHADPEVEAQLADSASWLLLDEGNPS